MPSAVTFFVACVALFFSCALSSAGGVGGGGLNVPIFLMICGYSFDTAATYSLFVVLGNSCAQTVLNFNKSHPNHGRVPMIYWEFICLLISAQLGGGNIGAALKRMLPEIVLYTVALVVLLFAATISLKKGLAKWQAETEKKLPKTVYVEQRPESEPSSNPLHEPLRLSALEIGIGQDIAPSSNGMLWPKEYMFVIMLTWVLTVCLRVGLSLTNLCSLEYYLIFFVLYIPLAWCSMWAVYYLEYGDGGGSGSAEKEKAERESVGSRHSLVDVLTLSAVDGSEEDIAWKKRLHSIEAPVTYVIHKVGIQSAPSGANVNGIDLKANSLMLLAYVFLIGVVSQLLGIGGAELISPLMLVIHISPEVTSATSGMMNTLNTSANVIIALVDSTTSLDAKFLLLLTGFLGGICGRYSGLYVASQLGRPSVIIFALVAGLYLTVLFYIYSLAAGGLSEDFSGFCKS